MDFIDDLCVEEVVGGVEYMCVYCKVGVVVKFVDDKI